MVLLNYDQESPGKVSQENICWGRCHCVTNNRVCLCCFLTVPLFDSNFVLSN